MKKIFNNSKLIAIAFFTVFTTAAAPTAFAHSGKELPVELKYIGNINNKTIFQLVVAGNKINTEYILTIRDPFGNSIYRENIKAENFSKKFIFDTDELGDDVLQFEVYCRKTGQTVLYNINRQTRLSEEMMIREIKQSSD